MAALGPETGEDGQRDKATTIHIYWVIHYHTYISWKEIAREKKE